MGGSRWREAAGTDVVVGAVVALLAAAVPGVGGAVGAQEPGGYENLQVLPADIERSELSRIMLANLSGLGLPRRANEGCLFCHVGSMDVPSDEWDWASDQKPMKVKARAMMAMVREINEGYLSTIARSYDDEVGCYACHAGRTNPMPLEEVLVRAYRTGGLGAVVERYRELRGRYFAADAYDFRTQTLAEVARRVAESGAYEAAAGIHQLNVDYSDDPEANRGLIRLRMLQALETGGVEATIDRFHASKDAHPPEVFSPGLIDALGWYLFRSDRREAAFRLFQLNFDEHPDEYVPTESLAWASRSLGDSERALELAEAWVDAHPDHELGLRLLSDMRRREEL